MKPIVSTLLHGNGNEFFFQMIGILIIGHFTVQESGIFLLEQFNSEILAH